MKRFVFVLIAALLLVPSIASARSVKMIGSDGNLVSLSFGYEYTSGQYEPVEGNTEQDTDLQQQLGTVGLAVNPWQHLQVFGMAGSVSNTFGDTDTEDGTVIGGGAQFLIEESDHLEAKLVGSYLQHESAELGETNREVEMVGDWQAGLLFNRSVRDSYSSSEGSRLYDAYFGVLYSGRELELTGPGTDETYEMANGSGLSASAGFNINYTPALDFEIAAELGAMSSASASVTYGF